MQAEFEALCSCAVACRRCFDELSVAPSLIDVAQPRWVGPQYGLVEPRVVVVMLNPGSGESRTDGADGRFRELIHAFADGSGSLETVLKHEARDMVNWGGGRFLRFYVDKLGLQLDDIAFANVAWCGTRGNQHPGAMLKACFERHTSRLLTILDPEVVLLSGSATHRFAKWIHQHLPASRVVRTLHYAHRKGDLAQERERRRVRKEIRVA
jgi:hypothetical protein